MFTFHLYFMRKEMHEEAERKYGINFVCLKCFAFVFAFLCLQILATKIRTKDFPFLLCKAVRAKWMRNGGGGDDDSNSNSSSGNRKQWLYRVGNVASMAIISFIVNIFIISIDDDDDDDDDRKNTLSQKRY